MEIYFLSDNHIIINSVFNFFHVESCSRESSEITYLYYNGKSKVIKAVIKYNYLPATRNNQKSNMLHGNLQKAIANFHLGCFYASSDALVLGFRHRKLYIV